MEQVLDDVQLVANVGGYFVQRYGSDATIEDLREYVSSGQYLQDLTQDRNQIMEDVERQRLRQNAAESFRGEQNLAVNGALGAWAGVSEIGRQLTRLAGLPCPRAERTLDRAWDEIGVEPWVRDATRVNSYFGSQAIFFGLMLPTGSPTPPPGAASKLAENLATRNWPTASLEQAISRHAGENYTTWVTRTGKRIFENPATGRQVVVDLEGGYFRIFQPNAFGSSKGTYLNLMGNEARPAMIGNNGIHNPLLRDVDKGLWQQETHYFIQEILELLR